MFKPRHAYRSPITSRYRGKAKGCPVFNNITDINSSMVEQHDECLECLAKIKNRTDLYRTLADNNKPSNNVIKSLQRLSSSASNNRLKTCLQFLIIRVNEKSIALPNNQQQSNGSNTSEDSQIKTEETTSIKQEANSHQADQTITTTPSTALATTTKIQNNSKRLRLLNQKQKPKYTQQQQQQKQKHNQLASPPQDQVSSTQDQLVPTTITTTTTTNNQDDHDCQTSPMMLVTTQTTDDGEHRSEKQFQDSPVMTIKHDADESDDVGGDCTSVDVATNCNGEADQEDVDDDDDDHEVDDEIEHISSPAQTHSSPPLNYALKTTATTTTNTSPAHHQNRNHHQNIVSVNCATNSKTSSSSSSLTTTTITTSTTTATKRNSISDSSSNSVSQRKASALSKRRKIHNSSDHDTSSTASWSSTSYASPHSPLSTSSTSSISSSSSRSSSSSCSSASSLSPTPSPSPLSSPDIINELKGPRLKLSEEKIRKIKKRPIIFDDFYNEHSFASTPTTSSGCSPGQHSNTTQNSDCSRLGLSNNNVVVHMFQAPPKFVNNLNLKTCNLPSKVEQPAPANTPPVPTKEMLNCAICGIKDRQPNISKIYGQNSCLLCARFFAAFLKRPQQLYCAQDGDCLMTFDSRCQACWIKICLQKFDIEEEHRKIGLKFSPKLLSSPNVSLITIDTSISR